MSRNHHRIKTSHLKKSRVFRFVLEPVAGFFFKGFAWLMTHLPPAVVYSFGRGLGWVIWLGSGRRRHIALRNLEIAFGDKYSPRERRCIARHSVQHFTMTALDVFLLPKYSGDKWSKRVTIDDSQKRLLQNAADHDGPVVMQTGHMGSWEFSSGIASYFTKNLTVVYRPLEFAVVDREIRRLRTSHGVRACPKKGVLRGYMKALKANEWVGVIADQNAGRSGAFVNFFGVPASTEASYFPLFQRFNTRIFTLFTIREGFTFRFKLAGIHTTRVNSAADPEDESMRLAQWYMERLEDIVRQYPEQYNWLHQRWRSRPAGAPSLYDDLKHNLRPELLNQQPAAPIKPAKWLKS